MCPSVDGIVRLLSGCTAADIARFRATGEFDDPWELARAACVWLRAGRPLPLLEGGWRRMINLYGDDPGDLAPRCRRLYREEWRHKEVPLIDTARLDELAAFTRVAACTGRSREELTSAEELLGFHFPTSTTREDVLAPDPEALRRLGPPGHFFGASHNARRLAEATKFVYEPVTGSPIAGVDRLLARFRA